MKKGNNFFHLIIGNDLQIVAFFRMKGEELAGEDIRKEDLDLTVSI